MALTRTPPKDDSSHYRDPSSKVVALSSHSKAELHGRQRGYKGDLHLILAIMLTPPSLNTEASVRTSTAIVKVGTPEPVTHESQLTGVAVQFVACQHAAEPVHNQDCEGGFVPSFPHTEPG